MSAARQLMDDVADLLGLSPKPKPDWRDDAITILSAELQRVSPDSPKLVFVADLRRQAGG